MKPLSEQLTELAARTKRSEDFVNAARTKNRAYLDDERETLKKSIATGKTRMNAGAGVAQDKTRTWWNDTRQSIDTLVAELRAERDDHRATHDAKKAERRAEDAEETRPTPSTSHSRCWTRRSTRWPTSILPVSTPTSAPRANSSDQRERRP
jgi:hypothetical protein